MPMQVGKVMMIFWAQDGAHVALAVGGHSRKHVALRESLAYKAQNNGRNLFPQPNAPTIFRYRPTEFTPKPVGTDGVIFSVRDDGDDA
jgi:hypothetical protein